MKKIISLVLAIVSLLSTVPCLASGEYVYTSDGDLYSLKDEKIVADNVKGYEDTVSRLYVLKNNNTLWVELKDMFYITNDVKNYKAESNTYAVIKSDNSLWIGVLNRYDITCVMENVKSVVAEDYEVLCITYDNKLYSWKFNDYTTNCIGEAELIMENVDKLWTQSGRYYASKTDGSLWAWGQNMARSYSQGGFNIYDSKSLLGLGDEYVDVNNQKEPARMALDNVKEIYFMEGYRTIAVTENDDLYYWGDRLYTSNEEFAPLFKVSNKPVKVHENVKTIKNGNVILTDGTLCWRYWHEGKVCDNVKDVASHILLTHDGKLYKWFYGPYIEPEIELTPILENVKEICDQYEPDYKVLCLCSDTTLIEIDTRSLEVTSIAANVKEAFYYGSDVYFIDNAYTLYKVEDGVLIPLLDNVVREIIPISININGEKITLDTDPYIKQDRTMVPMRAIFEALGATVSWDNETKTAIGVKDGVEVKITIGESALYKNGEAIELDCAAEIANSRTMVPVRAISEAFGCTVEWNNDTKTVNIVDPYNRTYYIYDEKGKVAATESANGNVVIRYEYLYDENGNVIRVWEKEMIKNSDRLFEYAYNEKGQRVSKAVCNDWWRDALYGGPIDKEVTFTEVEKYVYEDMGRLNYAEYPSGEKRYYIYEEDTLIREENEKGETVKKYVYHDDGRINYTESY